MRLELAYESGVFTRVHTRLAQVMLRQYLTMRQRRIAENRQDDFKADLLIHKPDVYKSMYPEDVAIAQENERDYQGVDTLENFDSLMDSLTAGVTITADMIGDDEGWI